MLAGGQQPSSSRAGAGVAFLGNGIREGTSMTERLCFTTRGLAFLGLLLLIGMGCAHGVSFESGGAGGAPTTGGMGAAGGMGGMGGAAGASTTTGPGTCVFGKDCPTPSDPCVVPTCINGMCQTQPGPD